MVLFGDFQSIIRIIESLSKDGIRVFERETGTQN